MQRDDAFRFLDTNAFIECRFFEEVDWARDLQLPSVCLMVAPKVVDELDNFKKDPHSRRRRDRSASVLKHLEDLGPEALKSPGAVLRPNVRLWILADRPDMQQFPDLSSSTGDDQIIAAALLFKRDHSNTELVTFDTGIRLRARQRGLTATAIPEELKLENEPDPWQLKTCNLSAI